MSFSFDFGGDDIEDGSISDDALETELAKKVEQSCSIATPNNLIPPQRHHFSEMLSSLPSQISYNLLSIPGASSIHQPKSQKLDIPRRSLFDIRAQLMVESNPDENDNDTLLAGLEAGDLSSGIYEGGFKTWECAVDLASFVAEQGFDQENWHVVELGAGSAIPSLVILQNALRNKQSQSEPDRSLRLTLCDYNEDVLRLATAPNILLNYLVSNARKKQFEIPQFTNKDDQGDDDKDQDLDFESFEPDFVAQIEQDLASKGITISLVSGAWGTDFVNLLTQDNNSKSGTHENLLILASETIYSPDSIRVFVDTVMSLLDTVHGTARALVAAKRVYFGVGGGVEEFNREVKARGGTVRELSETTGVGIGRVILEVTKKC